MTDNLKYLEKVVDEDERFGVILNKFAIKHEEHIQYKMALSLLEFFNSGKFVSENDIEKIGNIFYVSKDKYIKTKAPSTSKVFSVRVNIEDSEAQINQKLSELQEKVRRYRSSKFMEDLRKEYQYVKYVTLTKKVKFKVLKKKFDRCIIVSNEIDIEKEEWTKIEFENGVVDFFPANLELIYPIEKLPIFKLVELK